MVQANRFLHLSTAIIVPTSTSVHETLTHIRIGHLDQDTFALCEQVSAIDPDKRLGRFVGVASYEEVDLIDQALRLIQDL